MDVKIHENFNPSSYENDIAILKINRPTIFNNYIWPICLPPEGTSFENKNAIVIGMYADHLPINYQQSQVSDKNS